VEDSYSSPFLCHVLKKSLGTNSYNNGDVLSRDWGRTLARLGINSRATGD